MPSYQKHIKVKSSQRTWLLSCELGDTLLGVKMKIILILSSLLAYCQAGIVPASTTLLRQSTSITHPATAFTYSQPVEPVAYSYSAPVYTHLTPAIYSQQHSLVPAPYTTQFYGHHFLPQQPFYAQYPVGVIAQNPQYPAQNPQYPAQNPQYPQQFPVQGQEPVQGGQEPVQGPVIEPADDSQNQQQQQPLPQNPPQQAAGGSSNNVDDDTVSIEAA